MARATIKDHSVRFIMMMVFGFVLGGACVVAMERPAAAQKLGEEKMKTANRAAAKVVRERLATERPEDFRLLKDVKSAEIIVVQGSYDRVEDVLLAVGVPHVEISSLELEQIELNAKQLVMVNCAGSMSDEAVQKLARFVRAGGFLYTTDWALTNVIERAFPGTIKFNGNATANDVVEVEVVKKDNVFLQHIQLSKDKPKWWLEGSSYPIEIIAKDKVEVLITSKEMGVKYGAAPIAVTFAHGDGRVLHIASHFYLQQNELRTVAEKKSGGEYLKENSALPAKVAEGLAKDKDVAGADAGDLNSAYSTQQMTTNLIVTRKRDQARIDGLYSSSINTDVEGQAEGEGKKAVKKGTKVRVVERKGGKVKVRTMEGSEFTFDAALVE